MTVLTRSRHMRSRAAMRQAIPTPGIDPLRVHELVHSPESMPDIIEFCVSDKYLDRPNLYPRQATLLKVMFLAEEMLTQYDLDVIGEWEETFQRVGNEGISPQILERIKINKAAGRPWFREILTVLGRRGSKGHIGGLGGAFVLWHYMHRPGGPQSYYGIDRDKRLTAIVFAGKKEQATANQWRDLNNVILGGTCFAPYISRPQGERLTVFAPSDFLRMQRQMASGIVTESDQATFEIIPSPSTMMAGRGVAAFAEFFDEMAHVVATGSNRAAEDVYQSATPSLDQFGVDAFLYEGSSPWQMQGQFYENWTKAIEIGTDGKPTYPEMMMLQLPSWSIYEDWEDAGRIPLRPSKKIYIEVEVDVPSEVDGNEVVTTSTQVMEHLIPGPTLRPLKRSIQTYDDQMRQLEKANPSTFAVERRSHWSESMSSYLDREKIEEMFGSYHGELLRIQARGLLSVTYKGHGDPAKVNDNFGFAIGHTEPGVAESNYLPHVVFDVIHHWRPQDFENHTIDYLVIQEQMQRYLDNFIIDELTFDQWNSIMTIGSLNKYVQDKGFPKRISVFEKPATRPLNWKRAEVFKAALNMGLLHAPMLSTDGSISEHSEMAELELRFLEEKCYDDETEVLTERGWLLFRDVPECVRVATRSANGQMEWQFPTDKVDAPFDGEMYLYESNSLNFRVTPNHRMLVESAAPRFRGQPKVVRADELAAVGRRVVPVTHLPSAGELGCRLPEQDWPTVKPESGGRFYGVEEENFVRRFYADVPTNVLSGIMGRSVGSIIVWARKNGLKKVVRWGTPPLTIPDPVDLAGFIGFWIGDGTKKRPVGHQIELTQVKPRGLTYLHGLFDRLDWEYTISGEDSFRIRAHPLNRWLRNLCQSGETRLPADFLLWSAEERVSLLEGMLQADGFWGKREGRFIGFIAEHEGLIDDAQSLAASLGFHTRKSLWASGMWHLSLKGMSHVIINSDDLKVEPYSGRVYCLTVPNGTLYVRRGGIPMWCGNSGKVDHPSSGPIQHDDIANCHDDRTEVLTEYGWKLFSDVQVGEQVATRTADGRLEYQNYTDRVDRYYSGPMVAYRGHRLDFRVTPGHRMLVDPVSGSEGYRFMRADALRRGAIYHVPKTAVIQDRPNGRILVDELDVFDQDLLAASSPGGSRLGMKWTQQECASLGELFSSAHSMESLLDALPGRTRSAIYSRARIVGMYRPTTVARYRDRPAPLPEVDLVVFAKFLGFWLAEGRKYHGDYAGYDVKITQTKPEGIRWFDAVMTQTNWLYRRMVAKNGEVVWLVKSEGLRAYLRRLCVGDHDLVIPPEVFDSWSFNEMESLLEGLSWGDGNYSQSRQEHTNYNSSSKTLIDDVQRLMVHIGLSGQVRMVSPAGTVITGLSGDYRSKHDMWSINYDKKPEAVIKGSLLEDVEYNGMVHCLTVPNGTLMTRRNGKAMWSGNCMFEVVYALIGEEMSTFLGQALGVAGVSGSSLGGSDPYAKMNPGYDTSAGLAAVTGAAARQRGLGQHKSVARGGLASRGGMRRR